MNRTFLAPALTLAATLLSGCAAMNSLHNEVSTYGAWPTERKPATYAFERLPSQQAQPERQQLLEDAARPALGNVGFTPAAPPESAEYLLQLGVRVSNDSRWYDGDPMFWHGGARFGHGWGGLGGWGGWGGWGRGPWGYGGAFGAGFDTSLRFDREVAVLIRDRKSGQLLYEARASNNGSSASINRLLAPMFRAALADFPAVGPNPRDVTVPLSSSR